MRLQFWTRNDFWIDNALENFYRILKTCEAEPRCLHIEARPDGFTVDFIDRQAAVHLLTQEIASRHDKVIFSEVKDKKGLRRNIRLDYVLLPYGKKVAGRNVLVERFYNKTEMKRFLRSIMIPSEGSRICVLCNRPFDKNVGKLKQGVYPLATKNRALSGIRKKSDYIQELCPSCFVIGVLEWTDDRLPYRCSLDGQSILLFPHFADFEDLIRFKKDAWNTLSDRDLKSNVKVRETKGSDVYTGGKYSTLLLFSEQIIARLFAKKTARTILGDDLARVVCSDWTCLRVPSGVVKDVECSSIKVDDRVLDVASSVAKLLQERKQGIETGVYSEVIAKIRIKPEPGKPISWDDLREMNFRLRETLAKGFIENDLHCFASAFLPRKGFYVIATDVLPGLETLLNEWQFKSIDLAEQDIESIKKSADALAEICNVNAGLLYQMDRAQTAQDFVFTLKEGAKKLVGIADEVAEGRIRAAPKSMEDFFQLLANKEDKWKLLRDILVLYTSTAYASKKMSGRG